MRYLFLFVTILIFGCSTSRNISENQKKNLLEQIKADSFEKENGKENENENKKEKEKKNANNFPTLKNSSSQKKQVVEMINTPMAVSNKIELEMEEKKPFVKLIQGRLNFFTENFYRKYAVSLLGMEIGFLSLSSISKENHLSLFGELKNKSFYRYLYNIHDKISTTINLASFLPDLVEMEKDEKNKTSVSIQKLLEKKIIFKEKIIKNKKESEKERVLEFQDFFFDTLSFLRFVEVIEVEKYKGLKIPLVFQGKLYEMKVKKVETQGQIQKIYYDTFRENKLKKDQKIIIAKQINGEHKIVWLSGKMKVGELKGVLIED